jgi:esterase
MKLFFRRLGKGDPLIILHGLYGSSDNWMGIAHKLAENYDVILPDLRNHGKSPHSAEHTYMALSADLYELLDELKLAKVHLIGHSMGGKTAMQFYFDFPTYLKSLIVVDISPRSYVELTQYSPEIIAHLNIIKAMLDMQGVEITNRSDAERFMQERISDIRTVAFLLKNFKWVDGRLVWCINVDGLMKNLPNILAAVVSSISETIDKTAIPVMFVKGENSNYIEDIDIPNILSMFPQAQFTTVFNAGHWLHAEQPNAFLNTVFHFLQKDETL